MITKDSKIEDILRNFPEKTGLFVQMGLPCLVCGEPFWGTLEELCNRYNVDIDVVLKRLNENDKEAQT
ncbi:MAG: DUF1858 domain-containing protein [bacterium]